MTGPLAATGVDPATNAGGIVSASLSGTSPSIMPSPPLPSSSSSSSLIAELIDLESPFQLAPKAPAKCPIFCCFYAEFDIKKGPVVRYQSPSNFMDQDIGIDTSEIHDILAKTFESLERTEKQQHQLKQVDEHPAEQKPVPDPTSVPDEEVAAATTRCIEETSSSTSKIDEILDATQDQTCEKKDQMDEDEESIHIEPNQPTAASQSIFDSTSEYIITGSELTGKIITLSTHSMHVMTRPTQITHERYERNALLFSVGIVCRRAADPRPFRPLISKLALTLRSMEVESGVLSDPQKVHLIQPLLERILISMNSPRWECNILLDQSTALNLKLFHPPKPQTSPVHDYQVPVLLRRDLQLQMYEWDLAINWVILHIDGVTNARQISIKAQVDLEMVLACLRVLKHHGVISVVDMFLYSNRYEFTERAAYLLAGKDEKVLQEAADFVVKRRTVQVPMLHHPKPIQQPYLRNSSSYLIPPPGVGLGGASLAGGNSSVVSSAGGGGSDIGNSSPRPSSPMFAGTTPSLSYPPRSWSLLGGGSQRNSNFRSAIMASGHSLEKEASPFLGPDARLQQEDGRHLMGALAELYCACNRSLSFGDLWVSLTSEQPPRNSSNNKSTQPQQSQEQQSQHQIHRSSTISAATYHRLASARKDSLTEYEMNENEVMGFSPLEASLLESVRNNRSSPATTNPDSTKNVKPGTNISYPPNWNDIFSEFDHRRFFTFGVVHGLLIRVHSYPYYTGPPFPARSTFVAVAATTSGDITQNRQSTNINTHHNLKHQLKEEKRFQLAKSVAALMDGTRCDDELVSMFETPFNKLVELVEKYSGTKVMHIYATGAMGSDH